MFPSRESVDQQRKYFTVEKVAQQRKYFTVEKVAQQKKVLHSGGRCAVKKV